MSNKEKINLKKPGITRDIKLNSTLINDKSEILKKKQKSSIKLVLGPIIGKITHNSVIILMEFNKKIENIRCVIVNSKKNKQIFLDQSFEENIPKSVIFTDLEPNTHYFFYLEHKIFESKNNSYDDYKILGNFKTFEKNPSNLDIIAVYGNCTKEIISGKLTKFTEFISAGLYKATEFKWDSPDNLWIKILKQLNYLEDTDKPIVIHIGGQVNLYLTIKDLLANKTEVNKIKNMSSEKQRKYFEILFSNQYKINWSKSFLKKVLSSGSNIMIMGKTDIFYPDSDIDLSSLNLKVNLTKIALYIYKLYQAPLCGNILESNDNYHYHNWGKYGIFFVETLTESKKDKNALISIKQKESLEQFILSNKLKVCIIVTETPFVNNITSKIINNKEDKIILNDWPSTDYRYYKLFQDLEKIKSQKKDGRVLFIAGRPTTKSTMQKIPNKIKITNTETNQELFQLCVGNITGNNIDSEPFYKDVFFKKWNISSLKHECKNTYGLITIRESFLDNTSISTNNKKIITDMHIITKHDNEKKSKSRDLSSTKQQTVKESNEDKSGKSNIDILGKNKYIKKYSKKKDLSKLDKKIGSLGLSNEINSKSGKSDKKKFEEKEYGLRLSNDESNSSLFSKRIEKYTEQLFGKDMKNKHGSVQYKKLRKSIPGKSKKHITKLTNLNKNTSNSSDVKKKKIKLKVSSISSQKNISSLLNSDHSKSFMSENVSTITPKNKSSSNEMLPENVQSKKFKKEITTEIKKNKKVTKKSLTKNYEEILTMLTEIDDLKKKK